MWEKAMSQHVEERKNSVFLYMHSKGMVFHGKMNREKRKSVDGPLFKHVIEPWTEVLFRFQTVPDLDKAGFTVTNGGYVYFNYIWVRSSYVARLEAPIEYPVEAHRGGGSGCTASADNVSRYYYEHWIAHTVDEPPTSKNGWSMILEKFKLGVCFSLQATIDAFSNNRKVSLNNPGVFQCTR